MLVLILKAGINAGIYNQKNGVPAMSSYQTYKLSDPECRSAKPKDKLYKLRDGGALSLDIMPSGTKTWRYSYRIHGKQKTFTIGKYPDTSLSEARTSRDKAKKLVSEGIDPSQQKQIIKRQIAEDSFQGIAETWLEQMKPDWSEKHHIRFISYLSRDAFPLIGTRNIAEIEAPEIIAVIRQVADRGAVYSAKRIKGMIQQVFDYALVHGKCTRNPAKDINLSMLLPKIIKRHFSAITDPVKLGELLFAIDGYEGSVIVRQALKIIPFVMVRPSELSNAEWSEIDFDTCTWTIPAKRRKLPKHLKDANRPQDAHIVPLCDQVVTELKLTHQYTGRGKYIFPSARGNSRSMSNNALRTALRNMGFDNETITPHGFRGVASTFLNEQGFRTKVIEAQLAHKLKSEVEASYNHAQYIDERREMLKQWGNYLEALKQGADVVPIMHKG